MVGQLEQLPRAKMKEIIFQFTVLKKFKKSEKKSEHKKSVYLR
jgi:hypothetical protein